MIKIITVGKIKEKYLKDAIDEYMKRLSKYNNINLIEIKDEGLVEEEKAKIIEGEKIIQHISPKDYVITMEILGKMFDSLEFAKLIDNTMIENSNLTFVIGGSYGLSEQVKKRSNLAISFSKMTFPHQLFRVLLLEQIYRAYKINNHESYHK